MLHLDFFGHIELTLFSSSKKWLNAVGPFDKGHVKKINLRRIIMNPRIVLIVIVVLCSIGAAFSAEQVDWQAFSENLAVAVCSDNPGLRNSALCMVVQYAENLKIERGTIFDIVRIFRGDDDVNVRLLAMVALYKSGDSWAMDYLKRHSAFETNPRIQKLCCCAVKRYYAKIDSVREAKILANNNDSTVEEQPTNAAVLMDIQPYGF
jgi:hypothetical protein